MQSTNLVHVSTSQQSGHLLLATDVVTMSLSRRGLLLQRYGECSTGADSTFLCV